MLVRLRHRAPGLKPTLLSLAHFAEAILLAAELRRRGIDPSGQQTCVTAIQRGARTDAIIASIVSSAEYFGKAEQYRG